ncbi:MAG: redoxin domain-containing protein [Bacteriovoracaceae bacterium]|nr:redoxin domain-containing protein [Bacteriovoracaceae bacterium]
MNRFCYRSLVLFFCFFSLQAYSLSPGEKAANFELKDQNDKIFKLNQLAGKFIILEWFNEGCPFVQKHYESGNMQTLQKMYKDNDLVRWVTIISSAPGKQGHLESTAQLKKMVERVGVQADYILRDPKGKVGRMYGAKTTPHMFIIDDKMMIRYNGAIDSIASANPDDIKKAKNYITSAMSKVLLKQEVITKKTRPYGCSVKY